MSDAPIDRTDAAADPAAEYTPSGERLPRDEDDYGLDSDAGNARLGQALADLQAQVERGEVDRVEAVVFLADAVQALGHDHPEVTEPTVRARIVTVLAPVFTAQGWPRLEPFEF